MHLSHFWPNSSSLATVDVLLLESDAMMRIIIGFVCGKNRQIRPRNAGRENQVEKIAKIKNASRPIGAA